MRAALLVACAALAGAGLLHADDVWTGKPTEPARWAPATRQQPPETPDPLPPPRPVAPEPLPLPRPVLPVPPKPPTKPWVPTPQAEPPAPAPAPVAPKAAAPTPPPPLPVFRPAPEAPPAPPLEPWPGGLSPAVPYRAGVVGSPNVSLSRDYSLLDFFGVGLFGAGTPTAVAGEAAPPRGFVTAEFLLWWVRSGDVPVLATTAPAPGLGFLGGPGTQALLGPGRFGGTGRDGFRVRAGTLLGESGQAGLDGSFFFLGRHSTDFHADSGQFPTITRPFFAPNLNREFGEQVAYPGLATGSLDARLTSELWGADVNARCLLGSTCDARGEVFAGYRHLNLREELAVTEGLTAGPNAPDPAGTAVVVRDSFRVRNRFHGGQLGYAFARRSGAFEFDGRLSVALGVNDQAVEVDGSQTRTRPGQPAETFTGGLLAAGPNLGTFHRDRFSVAPEATFNVGVRLTDRLKAFAGYNFLYWSNVLRPGDQIDRTVDLSFVPNGPALPAAANRPLPTFRASDFWAQGVQFGVEYRW